MTFFDDVRLPPEGEEPHPQRAPVWMSAPENVVPGVVPLELVIARTDDTAVIASLLRAYSTGFEFRLTLLSRNEMHDPLCSRHEVDQRSQLRLGVQFSDGSKATNLDVFSSAEGDQGPEPPVLFGGGGGGGGRRWDQDYWVWPVPPDGPFAFVVAWPERGIEVTRTEVDAAVIRDAAARAIELWPEERDPPSGHGSHWRIVSS